MILSMPDLGQTTSPDPMHYVRVPGGRSRISMVALGSLGGGCEKGKAVRWAVLRLP